MPSQKTALLLGILSLLDAKDELLLENRTWILQVRKNQYLCKCDNNDDISDNRSQTCSILGDILGSTPLLQVATHLGKKHIDLAVDHYRSCSSSNIWSKFQCHCSTCYKDKLALKFFNKGYWMKFKYKGLNKMR